MAYLTAAEVYAQLEACDARLSVNEFGRLQVDFPPHSSRPGGEAFRQGLVKHSQVLIRWISPTQLETDLKRKGHTAIDPDDFAWFVAEGII